MSIFRYAQSFSIAMLCAAMVGTAAAQSPPPAMGPAVGTLVIDGQNALNKRDLATALAKAKAKAADAIAPKTPYEDYNVALLLGRIALQAPKPDNVAAAADFNRAIDSGILEVPGAVTDAEKRVVLNTAILVNYYAKTYGRVLELGDKAKMFGLLDKQNATIVGNAKLRLGGGGAPAP